MTFCTNPPIFLMGCWNRRHDITDYQCQCRRWLYICSKLHILWCDGLTNDKYDDLTKNSQADDSVWKDTNILCDLRLECCHVISRGRVHHRREIGIHYERNVYRVPSHDCKDMMTSSDGNIFHVTDPLWGEFTAVQWIPLTKVSDAELWWRHRAHYAVPVMRKCKCKTRSLQWRQVSVKTYQITRHSNAVS